MNKEEFSENLREMSMEIWDIQDKIQDKSSPEFNKAYNNLVQIVGLTNARDIAEAKNETELQLVLLKAEEDAKKRRDEEKSRNVDRAVEVGKTVLTTGASVYGAKKMFDITKMCLQFEDTNFMSRDTTKHVLKHVFSKDGLIGIIQKILR